MKKLVICLVTLFLSSSAMAQNDDDLVQFSGVVLTSDSLMGIPYSHIINLRNNRGTISNYKGFFSFVAAKGDTIRFSSVGFKTALYVIPLKLNQQKYSVIQMMTQDTIFLDETIIYPWPTKEEFGQAFLSLHIPDDALDRARRNLEREKLREMGIAMVADGNEAADFYFKTEARKYYWAGQDPPIQLFNIFAWKEFIEAWKRGDFKRRDRR